MATEDFDPEWEARCLLRASRVGTLATSVKGQPFASLVTPACAPDLSVLLLLSGLSGHTRHLTADPRCSLLVAGPQVTANPQTAPRVTITGLAERLEDANLKARYLALHPYASLYADFGDFGMWRITPEAGQIVGGFGRAKRLDKKALTPDPDAVTALAESEAGIIAHCNQDHADAMAMLAGSPGEWKMVAVDVDGFDLALDDRVIRIPWTAPVANAGQIRKELVRMTQALSNG